MYTIKKFEIEVKIIDEPCMAFHFIDYKLKNSFEKIIEIADDTIMSYDYSNPEGNEPNIILYFHEGYFQDLKSFQWVLDFIKENVSDHYEKMEFISGRFTSLPVSG